MLRFMNRSSARARSENVATITGNTDLVRLLATRKRTAALSHGIEAEDACIQTMADVSPTKWHLAHTTWFLESFVLPMAAESAGVDPPRPFDPSFAYLFNSYYEVVGERHPRHQRGMASRPTLRDVLAYRAYIDEHLLALGDLPVTALTPQLEMALRLAHHHEEQHQELMLTDLRHVLGTQPLHPRYRVDAPQTQPMERELRWVSLQGGLRMIGAQRYEAKPDEPFVFDNEAPRHQRWLEPFAIASRLVSEREYAEFIADGGYETSSLWLSDGWSAVKSHGWQAPLYWKKQGRELSVYDLRGERALDGDRPVTCVSLYEADAFARWAKARLPTEEEWEVAAEEEQARAGGKGIDHLYDQAWQWTASAYSSYPGFLPFAGDFGEYNGKFMCSQMVLRGGSYTTPPGHTRLTYRNFFPPDARWQTSGIRLAKNS
jgi:ergothioneine biosynthesis protein EgtB